jgi:hypothetical protein
MNELYGFPLPTVILGVYIEKNGKCGFLCEVLLSQTYLYEYIDLFLLFFCLHSQTGPGKCF